MNTRLHSFAIFVTDIEQARNFYEGLLGLPVQSAGSFGFQLFEDVPHVGVHPAQHPDARKLVGRHTGITFRVDGLLDLAGRLHDAGVQFINEPTQQGFGMMAMVADPDGNIMALWEDNVSQEDQA